MHDGEVVTIAVAHGNGPSGRLFATGGVDGVVKLWLSADDSSVKLVQNNVGRRGQSGLWRLVRMIASLCLSARMAQYSCGIFLLKKMPLRERCRSKNTLR